jgi:hypothetical protein
MQNCERSHLRLAVGCRGDSVAVVVKMAMQKGQEGENGGKSLVEDNKYAGERPATHLLPLNY